MSDKKSFSASAVNSYSQALYELANESKSLNKIEDQVVALIKLIFLTNVSEKLCFLLNLYPLLLIEELLKFEFN